MTAATLETGVAGLGARRSRSRAAARRRSRMVQALRLILLALIAVVVMNAMVQLALHSFAGGNQPSFEPAAGAQRIVNPRFVGRDESGAPFTLTAASAMRREGGVSGIADLERPSLDYVLVGTGDASQVLADTGVFDEAAQTLHLGGQVRLTTRSGYAFQTEAAMIRLRDGEIIGDAPVHGISPWGAVRADRFAVYDDGRRIILSGDVRSRFNMNETEETSP